MTDITTIFNKYRECTRNMWNTYFLCSPSSSIYDMRDEFDEISRALFSVLVLNRLDQRQEVNSYGKEPFDHLRIVPARAIEAPIMINRKSTDGNIYWDEPVEPVKEHDIELKFIGYFDWDKYGYINLQYYLTRIVSFSRNPQLVGRNALIETFFATPFLVE